MFSIKIRFLIQLLPLFIFSNCIREIEYRTDAVPKQLVVNAIVEANHLFEVNISTLESILDSSNHFVDDALVTICSNGFCDTLKGVGNGNYNSDLIAKEGGIYSISVIKDGYPNIYAVDTVPIVSRIIKASKKLTNEVAEYGTIYNYSVTFECNTYYPQYYELMFIEQVEYNDLNLYQINFNRFDVVVDPIIQKWGDNNLSNTYLFSTNSIHNTIYTLNMKMQDAWSGGSQFIKPLIFTGNRSTKAVVLRTVSQAYVDYRVSWENHEMLKNDSSKVEDLLLVPLIGQQQEMFTNVEGGKGVFVCYAQSYFIFD